MKIFNTNYKKKLFLLAGGGFMPITNFPAFKNYAASSSLAPFINNLYTYAIGIAVILAVIEIIWGGFLWMGSGASISNKEAGRSKIVMSIFGLILVLSPYLILSVINPSILSLKLGNENLNTNKVTTSTSPTTKSTCQTNQTFAFHNGCFSQFLATVINNGGLNSSGYILACKTLDNTHNTSIFGLSKVCIYNKNSPSTPVKINTVRLQKQISKCSTNTYNPNKSIFQSAAPSIVTTVSGGCSGADWKKLSSSGKFKNYMCVNLKSPPKSPDRNYVCLYKK